jgi:hypothetical protein
MELVKQAPLAKSWDAIPRADHEIERDDFDRFMSEAAIAMHDQ